MLDGKRLLITGVVNRDSIAFATAKLAQELGAQIALTSFGRVKRITERAAKNLDGDVPVWDLDVRDQDTFAQLGREIDAHWGGLDAALHAIAFAPEDALGGAFLTTPLESAVDAFTVSAYSLKPLATTLLPRFPDGDGAIVGLDFDATVAWPAYDWMGVSKAALEATSRYLARDLGPHGVRVNLVSAGPVRTVAAGGIKGFSALADQWGERAPLGWDTDDAGPVASACCFLMSRHARGITGEIVHVDGGFHAIGTAVPAQVTAE
jgi:enoyl-[acyl-carrier protein] reductase I